MKLNRNNAGLEAEQLAATFLQNHGLTLVIQNYHCRYGEIDLVMRDQQTLVFVEVRMRKSAAFGGAAASITHQKQQKLIAAAQHYLQQTQSKQSYNSDCRFDAVLMDKAEPDRIEWIRNAFDA